MQVIKPSLAEAIPMITSVSYIGHFINKNMKQIPTGGFDYVPNLASEAKHISYYVLDKINLIFIRFLSELLSMI